MRKKGPSGDIAPISVPPAKRNTLQKNRRLKQQVKSRYFPKVDKFSFRFLTRRTPANATKKKKGTQKCKKVTEDDDSIPKSAREGDKIDAYSMLTENTNTQLVALSGATSDYFLCSPSSAYGSVVSLEPLVYTWISRSNRQDIRSNCSRQISPSASIREVCKACEKILREDAFLHFEACPIFREELDAYILNHKFTCGTNNSINVRGKDRKPTCVELVGQWAEEKSLRHLCPNQCYLRAFAPSREWMILRKKLQKLVPIGGVLKDWTCRLVHETELKQRSDLPRIDIERNAEAKIISSVKLLPVQLPRTLFVSLKSSKSFPSYEKALKSILDENDPPTNMICNQISTSSKSKQLTFDEKNYEAAAETVASPFGLLEELFPEEPWRVLISTMLLNKTQRKQNLDGILFHLFQRWPTAESVVEDADDDEEAISLLVFALVRPTGLGRSKAKAFVKLSRDYVALLISKSQEFGPSHCNEKSMITTETSCCCEGMELDLTREEVKQIFNCGDYAADAYQIFVRGDFESPVFSNDDMLLAYVEWKRSLSRLLLSEKVKGK
uniref:Uncharacterized protein n=1 Tax=Pseudo-nitzschia australis TaxID=44445 RepID=A0A7S4AAU8_9STRA